MDNPRSGTLEGWIITPDGVLDGHLSFHQGHITEVTGTPVPGAGFNPAGLTIAPGLVDLHNHGGLGGAFPTGTYEQARQAALFHRQNGTTTLLASMVSAAPEALIKQVKKLTPLCQEGLIHGFHLEGPYINACRCGAQNPEYIYPGNPADFAAIIAAAPGWIRSITLAPETDNLEDMLDLCAQHHIICSFGHTDADFEQTQSGVDKALERGLTVTATHLFNAMPPLHHRAPGAAGALLAAAASSKAYVELVADGVHLHDGIVDTALNNAVFVTDAMEAAGMPDGDYLLGQLEVVVSDGVARLTDGTLAGGTSTLAQQFARHVARGMSLIHATTHTSSTPAAVLGLHKREITVGAPLNTVVFNSSGKIDQVWTDGPIV